MPTQILVVDNEQRMCTIIKQSLELENYFVTTAYSGKDAIITLKEKSFHIVITDLKMSPVDGMQVLNFVKENFPSTEVIIITAFATQETALEAMKQGAYDYLIKPFKMDELIIRVERIVKQHKIIEENEKLKSLQKESGHFEHIIGKSKKMREVFDLIKRVAGQDVGVLVRGESGTGKELVAHAIHESSTRKNERIISINCAALPETLLESELFGFEKGAFTGANQTKPGLFELADKGTLFLDEIGDLSLNLQAKLLRVLQNKEITRLGGSASKKIDVRLITATHQNLENMIEDQKFRSDLYYRINLFPIKLPPLRERKEDIPELIEHFMENYSDKILSLKVKRALMEYDYPGNVRELENIISRSAIVSDKVIEHVDLNNNRTGFEERQDILSEASQFNLDDHIKTLLKQAISIAEGNKSRAAEILGITRRRLYSMMKTYGIE
jgi:DNA-binding NtrC family response regulator